MRLRRKKTSAYLKFLLFLFLPSLCSVVLLQSCSSFNPLSFTPFVSKNKSGSEKNEKGKNRDQEQSSEIDSVGKKELLTDSDEPKWKRENVEESHKLNLLRTEKIPSSPSSSTYVVIENGWKVEFFYPKKSTEFTSDDDLLDMIISQHDDSIDEEELESVEEIPLPESITGVPREEIEKIEKWFLEGYGSFNIPVEMNEYVEYYIYLFTKTKYRKYFERWLSRYFVYAPLMRQILRSECMPDDLVFVAMAESGFSTRAVSHMQAVGPWQFIKGTAQRYGLKIDYWIDERRDFVRSTYAAISYLKELYDMFGDWYLAWAGYNAGERRIQRALEVAGKKDFWYLVRRRLIPRETMGYVPKIIAVALITKNLEKFGFSPNDFYSDPVTFDEVELQIQLDIWTISKICGCDLSEILDLNPHMRRIVTPPYPFTLKIPAGKKYAFYENLKKFESVRTYFVPLVNYDFSPFMQGDYTEKTLGGYLYIIPDTTLNTGTLSDIFAFESWEAVKHLNELDGVARPGTKIKVPLYVYIRPYITYRVKRGDTLRKIAGKFGVSVATLKKMNGLESNSVYVGQVLKIPRTAKNLNVYSYDYYDDEYQTKGKRNRATQVEFGKREYRGNGSMDNSRNRRNNSNNVAQNTSGNITMKGNSGNNFVLHTVKKGENLYQIAKRYGVSWTDIKNANNLSSHLVYPGQKLIIPIRD